MPKPTFLIISQVYVPDPASVGQHIADAAAEMARRGFRVVVYASARGYDDPSKRYPARETLHGVEVRRLPLSSFGKSSIAVRLLAQWLFLAQAVLRGLFTRPLAAVMVSTSPPFCGLGGVIISLVRGVPLKYWLMDLNPDQMVALGKISERSLMARVFNLFNRWTYRRASDIVVLDRFMGERIKDRLPRGAEAKVHTMPPWPHEDQIGESLAHEANPFRTEHGLDGKFVVMYSGNHSPANPLKTLLDAAERLRDDPRLLVLCIGGGGGKKEVDDRVAAGARNIRSLPYQPFDRIRYSLSAADVHVVSIGDGVVGIVHPCKVYGAMAVSRPILLLGPNPCHVSDLIAAHRIGWHIGHGDVDGAVRTLKEAMATPEAELRAMGERAASVIAGSLSKRELMGRYCDVMERGVRK
ncbi:MAG: glycosyltransferase family 4 protein [Phycisphaerae bacterium]|nr:glycosyltransferase family 4 protein [Phycisphaerae bacterium]